MRSTDVLTSTQHILSKHSYAYSSFNHFSTHWKLRQIAKREEDVVTIGLTLGNIKLTLHWKRVVHGAIFAVRQFLVRQKIWELIMESPSIRSSVGRLPTVETVISSLWSWPSNMSKRTSRQTFECSPISSMILQTLTADRKEELDLKFSKSSPCHCNTVSSF